MHRALVLLALLLPAAPLSTPLAFAFVLLGEGLGEGSDGQLVPMVRAVCQSISPP